MEGEGEDREMKRGERRRAGKEEGRGGRERGKGRGGERGGGKERRDTDR